MSDLKKIFLSYAKEDVALVDQFYEIATGMGYEVFMDNHRLGVGTWRSQIERAISQSNVFILFLSKHVKYKIDNRAGFIESELDYAFNISRSVSPNEFQMIPLRLDDSYRGDFRASIYQQFDLFPDFELQAKKIIKLLDKMSPIEKLEARVETFQAAHDFMNAYANIIQIEYLSGQTEKTVLGKARFLYNMKEFNQAIALVRAVADEHPSRASLLMLANMLAGRKQNDELLSILDRCLAISPQDLSIRRWRENLIEGSKSELLKIPNRETLLSPTVGTIFYTNNIICYTGDPWFGEGKYVRLDEEYEIFVHLGSLVKKGEPLYNISLDILGSYESIQAEYDCKIIAFHIENNQDVAFKQPVMDIVPWP